MILYVVDANGVTQAVVAQSPNDTIQDRSATFTATGDSETLLEAVPDGFVRAGWFFQNNSMTANSVLINEIGTEASASPTCFVVPPGGTFPPPGYPVPQGAVNICGTQGDSYAAREWVTPVPQT